MASYPIPELIFVPPHPGLADQAFPTLESSTIRISKTIGPPSDPSKPTIVLSGGNAMSMVAGNCEVAGLIERGTGFETYTWDYPGYGASGGPPSPTAAVVALQVLVEALRKAGHSFICLWGHSLGTGISVKAAASCPIVKALILTAPFSNTLGVTSWRLYGRLPEGFEDPFPSATIASTLKTPMTIFHGDRDRIIPFEEGEALFKASIAPIKGFLRMDGHEHNDLFSPRFPFFKVKDFLAQVRDYSGRSGCRSDGSSSLACRDKAPVA